MSYYDRAVRKYHGLAVQRGCAIVPACGLDSLPADLASLGVLYSPSAGPAVGVTSVEVYMTLRAMRPSLGTVLSCVPALARWPWTRARGARKAQTAGRRNMPWSGQRIGGSPGRWTRPVRLT